jgi:two-component system sensor histidine kinase AlgZ
VHPILGRAERLAAYLAAWLIVCVLLASVFTRLELTWLEALALLGPLCLVYAFVCLSAWYVSRATPLGTSSIPRILASSGLAASVASGLWIALARVWIAVLTATVTFAPAADRYARQMPFVFASGVLLFLLALAVHYTLLAFEAAREAERRQLDLEILARDAELRALRAQLDPHFLYNSLNSISAMTASDPSGARRMCVLLGEFLRNTLNVTSRARISLADELALADRFLTIEQVRFGRRLQIERRVDESASACLVPPLLLQPLVENAVSHGVANLVEGGCIRLGVQCKDGVVSIEIENSFDPDAPPRRKSGVGLMNVRQRLAARYGNRSGFSAKPEGEVFKVAITLPAEKEVRPA